MPIPGALQFTFAPIVSLSNEKVFAHDTRVEWDAPARADAGAPASADDLWRAAEAAGHGVQLARALRARLAAHAASARTPFLFVSIRSNDLLDEQLYQPGSPLGAVARRIVLKLAQYEQVEEIPEVEARIEELRRMGFRLAFEDVDSGPAGLAACALLGPDFIQLGPSFMQRIRHEPLQRRMVQNLCNMFRGFQTFVIASGVADVDERDGVLALGCELGQGPLFGPPSVAVVTGS